MNKNIAIVLEGGGAKCAYQAGAIIALEELKYKITAIAGSSFGALTGALYIEGGTKKLINFYTSAESSDFLSDPELANYIDSYDKGELDLKTIIKKYVLHDLTSLQAKRKSLSPHFHNLVMSQIDEEAIRKSKIDFIYTAAELPPIPVIISRIGLSFNKDTQEIMKSLNAKGYVFDKENTPTGSMPTLVACSANYPVFEAIDYNGIKLHDGGIFDNIPYHSLVEKGYKDILIIRNKNDVLNIDPNIPGNVNIDILYPKQSLGSVANFNNANFLNLLKIGYEETKSFLKTKK